MAAQVLKGTDLRVEDKLDKLRQQIHDHRFAVEDEIRRFVNRYVTVRPNEARSRTSRTLHELVGNIRAELGLGPAAHPAVTSVVGRHVRDLVLGRAQASEDSARWAVHHAASQVTMYSGQFVYDAEDIFIDGGGIDFVFHRTYKSQGFTNGPLGANWDHNHHLALRVLEGGLKIARQTGNFQESEYNWSAAHGYWSPPPGEHSAIFEVSALQGLAIPAGCQATHFLRLPEGRLQFYSEDPGEPLHLLLCVVVDRHGNTLSYDYEQGPSGLSRLKLVRINCAHRYTAFEYDTEDRIVAIYDHTGRQWRYTYDDSGDLVEFRIPGGDRYPSGLSEEYVYSTAFAAGELRHKMLNVYDTAARLSIENTYGTDPGSLSFGRIVAQRVGTGLRYFEYQDVALATGTPAGELEEDLPTHQTILVRRNGHPVHYIYNRFGNLIAEEEDVMNGARRRHLVHHYRYNRDGGLIGECSPEGRVTQFLYGRDLFLLDHHAEGVTEDELREHAHHTWKARLSFRNRLAVVQRGRLHTAFDAFQYPNPLTLLNLSLAALDTAHDAVVKFTYDSDFQQITSVSHPEYTHSPFPNAAADNNARFRQTVTTFHYDAATGSHLEEIRFPDCTIADGTRVTGICERFLDYDSRGRLLLHEDRGGARTAFEYYPPQAAANHPDAAKEGHLHSQTLDPGALNLLTTYEVNAAGALTQVTTPKRQVTNLTPDSLNRITKVLRTIPARSVVDAATGMDMQKPEVHYETRFFYCRNQRVERVERDVCDDEGHPLWGGPEVQFFHYDENDNVVRQQTGGLDFSTHSITRHTYDDGDLRTTSTLPRGNRVRIDYDERRLARRITRGAGTAEAATLELSYDGDGLLIEQIDGRGLKAELLYDGLGRVRRTTDYDERSLPFRIVRKDYDKSGNLDIERLFEYAGSGNCRLLYHASYRHDELNQCIESCVRRIQDPIACSDAEVDAEGTAVPVAEGVCARYFYDTGGRIVRLERHGYRYDTNGVRASASTVLASSYEYNAIGWPVAEVDALGNRIELSYDAHGLVTRVDVREQSPASATGEEVFTTLHNYDALDRLIAVCDGMGNTTRFAYDSRDAVIVRRDPLGNVVRFEYNTHGRRVAERIEMTETGLGGGPRLPQSDIVTQYAYDANGNLVRFVDAHGAVTEQTFDSLDRRAALLFQGGAVARHLYDGNDNLVWRQNPNGVVQRTTFNPLDQPLRTDIDVTGLQSGLLLEAPHFEAFEHDAMRRMTRACNDWSDLRRKYDSLGHCYEEQMQFFGLGTIFLRRDSDDFGFVARLTYPSGRILSYEPDGLNRIARVGNQAHGAGYAGNAALPAQRTLLENTYHGLRIGSRKYGNGASTAYTYDAAGRVTGIVHACPHQVPLLALQFLYDAAGNLRRHCEFSCALGDHVEAYGYDSRSQLTLVEPVPPAQPFFPGAFAPGQTRPPDPPQLSGQLQMDALLGSLAQTPNVFTWRYDKLGNRLEERTPNHPPAYYASNILNQVISRDGITYSYDPAGNLAGESSGSIVREYVYNHRDQLARAKEGADLARYRHDAIGRRIWSQNSAGEAYYIYDGDNLIEDYRIPAAGSLPQLAAQYVNEAETDSRCHLATGGAEFFYHKDLIRSTRALTNDTGQCVASYRFFPFGALTAASLSPVANPFLFAGRPYDSALGLYDFRARTFSPPTGAFLQRDPKGYEEGMRLYEYARNNPFRFVDPFGEESTEDKVIADLVKVLENKDIPYSLRVHIRVRVGNEWVEGRPDILFRDPQTRQFRILEAKGERISLTRGSTGLGGQKAYLPALQAGAEWEVIGEAQLKGGGKFARSAAELGLTKGFRQHGGLVTPSGKLAVFKKNLIEAIRSIPTRFTVIPHRGIYESIAPGVMKRVPKLAGSGVGTVFKSVAGKAVGPLVGLALAVWTTPALADPQAEPEAQANKQWNRILWDHRTRGEDLILQSVKMREDAYYYTGRGKPTFIFSYQTRPLPPPSPDFGSGVEPFGF